MAIDVANSSHEAPRDFAIIFALGAPGAGKGTLCTHLARVHNLAHFSVGDILRTYVKANRHTVLADRIQQKLDWQGFLTFEDISPFLCKAIKNAMEGEENVKGIILDGFPRCLEQAKSFEEWHFQVELPLRSRKPVVVLSINVTKENAKPRYLARARDSNDSEEKFERRFAEYERESPLVEELYRTRVLIDIDANGTKEENINELTRKLGESSLNTSCGCAANGVC
ncbi:adenylate kinase 1 ATP binding protein [Zopfia rhizophila CBS 207.26]|uniref:Adenylate kinase 1 ATP binding protein n=1 Tax=Zopfia rhizophila CBS 207.26 TaxID=1314779 RepID=A0A6A6EH06_9PEZI|nr:adenylate kinase 1 ATP binding protein [Zopfia rhizophila CBS 207.26]